MRAKSKWTNKKHGKKVFVGSYETKKNGQRIFNLTCEGKEISFESYAQAKSFGWVKV
jgi:hypothetical protein